jgi:transitional endoplasmic reticulum ATPase
MAHCLPQTTPSASVVLEGSQHVMSLTPTTPPALKRRAGWLAGGLSFRQLGGVAHLVPALRQLVTLPLRAPHVLSALRLRAPRGVLLHGPPGEGGGRGRLRPPPEGG